MAFTYWCPDERPDRILEPDKDSSFYKFPSAGQDIVQLEYFIDNDPVGIGQTQIPITANDSIDIVANIDLSTVQQGHHRLFLRAKSANGFWSLCLNTNFHGGSKCSKTPNMPYLEFRPGYKHGNKRTNYSRPVIDVSFSPITAGLTPGFNVLYVRAKMKGNMWSMPIQKASSLR